MQHPRMSNYNNHSPNKLSKQILDLKGNNSNSQTQLQSKLPPLASKFNSYNRNRSINNQPYNARDLSIYSTKNSNNVLARGGKFQFQGGNEMVESDHIHNKYSQPQLKPRNQYENDSLQNEMLKREVKNHPIRLFFPYFR